MLRHGESPPPRDERGGGDDGECGGEEKRREAERKSEAGEEGLRAGAGAALNNAVGGDNHRARGPSNYSRHVTMCHLTRETMVRNVVGAMESTSTDLSPPSAGCSRRSSPPSRVLLTLVSFTAQRKPMSARFSISKYVIWFHASDTATVVAFIRYIYYERLRICMHRSREPEG